MKIMLLGKKQISNTGGLWEKGRQLLGFGNHARPVNDLLYEASVKPVVKLLLYKPWL